MFFSEYKKTKKNKKKTRTYLRLEIVSSIFTRYATLYRGGACYSKRNGARAANDYYIQNVQNSI